MSRQIYRVLWIKQDDGAEAEHYVITDSLDKLADEYADIIRIEPLGEVVEL